MVTRPTVLVTAPRAVQALARYKEELGAAGCDVTSWPTVERLEEHELLPLVGDVDALICGDDRITGRGTGRRSTAAGHCQVGNGHRFDRHRRRQTPRDPRVQFPRRVQRPVADTVLGYVLLFARQLDRMAEDMRAGLWQRRPLRALSDCTLGIVGLGASGRAVARRASSFGMRVLANCLQPPTPDEQRQLGLTMVALETLLAESDFVTLHADLRPENRHLIDEGRIGQMKPRAVLINTARGQLVDETALTRALVEGRIAGAALDVFEEEPLSLESPLRKLPNVYLAPHNANSSFAAAERVHANTIRHVLQVLGTNRV